MVLVSTPDPSLLALAVVTAAVGALHDTGSTIGTLVMTMVVTRLSCGLVGLIKHNDHSNENGCTEGKDALGGRHVAVILLREWILVPLMPLNRLVLNPDVSCHICRFSQCWTFDFCGKREKKEIHFSPFFRWSENQ